MTPYSAVALGIWALVLGLTVIGGRAEAACDEDCSAACKICVGFYCVNEPTCYGNCFQKKTRCIAQQSIKRDEPFHGHYCGNGNSDPTYTMPGIDPLDEACKAHDQCWDQKTRFDCTCDKLFATRAAMISLRSDLSNNIREKATAMWILFAGTPCVPSLK